MHIILFSSLNLYLPIFHHSKILQKKLPMLKKEATIYLAARLINKCHICALEKIIFPKFCLFCKQICCVLEPLFKDRSGWFNYNTKNYETFMFEVGGWLLCLASISNLQMIKSFWGALYLRCYRHIPCTRSSDTPDLNRGYKTTGTICIHL